MFELQDQIMNERVCGLMKVSAEIHSQLPDALGAEEQIRSAIWFMLEQSQLCEDVCKLLNDARLNELWSSWANQGDGI